MSNLSLAKIHGGKGRLSSWIISQLPIDYTKLTYIEPYGGMASVLLNKEPSTLEILNDIDYPTYCVYSAFKHNSKALLDKLSVLQYNEVTFKDYQSSVPITELDIGIREIVLRRFSRGGLKKDFAWSDRLRGGRPGDENAWINFLDKIPTIADRLKDVEISNLPALDLLKKYNQGNCLFYLDPPYLLSTRTAKKIYENEMTELDHVELVELIKESKSKILLSGYFNDLYDSTLKGWFIESKIVKNNAGQRKKKTDRLEIVWKNY